MNLDVLNAYITGELNKKCFFKEIEDEVIEFMANINSGFSSVQIVGSSSNYNEFGSRQLLSLLYKYLDGEIYEWELEYILRVVEFTFEDEDERVENVIFSFSDPYLNYNINEENVESAIKYLTGCIDDLSLHKSKGEKLRINYHSVFHKESV